MLVFSERMANWYLTCHSSIPVPNSSCLQVVTSATGTPPKRRFTVVIPTPVTLQTSLAEADVTIRAAFSRIDGVVDDFGNNGPTLGMLTALQDVLDRENNSDLSVNEVLRFHAVLEAGVI